MQLTTGLPSSSTVQQPHCPDGEQPSLGLVTSSSSRRAASRCGWSPTSTGLPLSVKRVGTASTMPRINKLLKSFACQDREPALGRGRTTAMPSRLVVNHRTSALPPDARPGAAVHAFHQRLPGYERTPLRDMPALAAACGVGRVLVKDESSRLGLPAFKILGASWATYRVLCDRLGGEPEWTTLDDLAAVVADRLGPLRLVAATDGNHGRAVAHMARLLGLSATILVPDGTADARIDGIASEGAEVIVAPGTYDDAVSLSAEMAGERDLVISDTSWPGYEDPPRWVIEGYATIFAEIDAALEGGGVDEASADAGDDVTVTADGIEVGDPVGSTWRSCRWAWVRWARRRGRRCGRGSSREVVRCWSGSSPTPPPASPPPSRPGTSWRCPGRTARSWPG